MSAIQDARDILEKWGKELTEDLEASLNQALRDGGNRNPQQAALNFREEAYIDGAGVELQVLASGDYWRYIESGRKKGARRLPADRVGKVWQNQNGIDARQVIIKLRAKSKSPGLNYKQPKVKRGKAGLNYDKAARSLSFIIQNSIFRKGIKPKPFVDRVLEDGRIEILSSTLAQVLGKGFKLEIITELNGNNN